MSLEPFHFIDFNLNMIDFIILLISFHFIEFNLNMIDFTILLI